MTRAIEGLMPFQSLIGRLGTSLARVMESPAVVFQSLIGRLGTKRLTVYPRKTLGFQSLIGRLGTGRGVNSHFDLAQPLPIFAD